MKMPLILSAFFLLSCNHNGGNNAPVTTDSSKALPSEKQPSETKKEVTIPTPKIYSNKRFRNVSVEKTGAHSYRIKGQGQIFEANFNWIVEDGHSELQKGFQMTDAGAPAWGNFEFVINVQKKQANSTLTLILFEASAKDGSRQFELPIILEWLINKQAAVSPCFVKPSGYTQ